MKTTFARFPVPVLVLGLAALGLNACGRNDSLSEAKDIYVNDAQTRKAATAEQMAWTVNLGGAPGRCCRRSTC